MLFAGWLIPRKRLDLVLAVSELIPDVTVVIVGDGPLMAECKRQAETSGITNRIIFVGQKKPEQMPALYSAADVLILPSDREGWANVLLESMACGTPVVSRHVGGAPDLITEAVAGRVVDSDKPEDIAQAVKAVLESNVDRRDVRDFASKFSWDQTSEAQYAIFNAVIDSREN